MNKLRIPGTYGRKIFRPKSIIVTGRRVSIIVALGFLVFTGITLYLHYKEHIRRTEKYLNSMNLVIREHIALSIRNVEGIITAVSDRLHHLDPNETEFSDFLLMLRHEIPFLRGLVIVDKTGMIVTDSRGTKGLDLKDRTYFRAHTPTGKESIPKEFFISHESGILFIGNPHKSRRNDEWFIPLSAAVRDKEGNLMYVVMASLNPLYFESLFDSIELSAYDHCLLQKTDGTIWMHYPSRKSMIGKKIPDDPLIKTGSGHPEQGFFLYRCPLDNVTRYTAVTTLLPYPLMVRLSIEQTEILKPFYFASSIWVIIIALGIAGLFFVDHMQTRKTAIILDQSRKLDKNAEEIRQINVALSASEDRFRTLFEHANDAIFFITEREEIIDVNHRACEMFGYSREELLNMKISQLQPGTDPELQIYANPYLSLDAPIEMTGLRKDGTLSAIEITITPLISGRQTLLMSIMRDITERKKAEEASRKFEFIANASKDLMTLVDRDYVYEAVNKAYCEAYQKPQEQLLGKTVEAVWGMETFYSKIKNNMDLALSGSEVSYEAWFEFHGRGKGFYKVIFYPYFNEKNEVTHTVVVSHDITKRKMAEQELVRLNKELNERVNQRTAELLEANRALKESLDKLQRTQNQLVQSEKMASLGSLVAGVSHEINTPIGIGVTGASLLDERTREIEDMFSTGILKRSDLEKYIQTAGETSASILSNLRRASELIQGFKQVAVDQSTEEKRMFKLREYIDEVLLSLRPRYKRTNHTISVQCSDDLELNSFPGAFMQIITNLVMNSLIHGFEKTDHGHITIDVEPVDTLIVFRYADNGKGIEQDIVKKIFDPFFTTKRGQGGTGLGLHIVYNLVTQTLNGEIECESTPGEKTEFTIRIPTACKPPEEKNNTSITDIRLSLK